MPQQKKVIVVGAGVAGLACAARLAAQGVAVTLFERNPQPGGKLGILEQGGYTWDTGPSLFTQPGVLEDLFRDCGKDLRDYFSYEQRTEGTQYFWEDGTALHADPDKERLAENVRAAFGIPAEPLLAYLDDAALLYHRIGSIFLDEPIRRARTWNAARVLPALKALKGAYLFRTLHAYNERSLQHPKLVQLLDRMATYNGSDPYRCPAMLSMIAHLELNEGSWYPRGGMISIPIALQRLCSDLGVRSVTGTDVQRVTVSGSVTGIIAGSEAIRADAVISNSDVYYTYRDLLQDQPMASRLLKQERSSSGIIFYWGISRSFPRLRLHNVFFSEHYREEFKAIFTGAQSVADPTVYINITSKAEPGHAPADCENWFVLINRPSRTTAISPEEIALVKDAVLAKLTRMLGEDIGALIRTEQVLTPDGIQAGTGSYAGALYGTSSNAPMAAFLRHPNHSEKYPGLFFAGGTVHPGGGIPLCLRSGMLAAAEALRYLG